MVRFLCVTGMPAGVLLWVRPVKSGHIVYVDAEWASGLGGDQLLPWKPGADDKGR